MRGQSGEPPDERAPRVVHVTTVHPWSDNRIFEKMVRGLVGRGWDVTYIAPAHPTLTPPSSGARYILLQPGQGWTRRLRRDLRSFLESLRSDARIIHFHDPEFLPFAFLLRLLGKAVIYDVHEDNYLALQQKGWGPQALRKIIALLVGAVEQIARRALKIVIAEKVYAARFPNGVAILNYPATTDLEDRKAVDSSRAGAPSLGPERRRLLYTGVVTVDRGAFNHVELLKRLPDYELHIVGSCSDALKDSLVRAAGDSAARLYLEVSPHGIPFTEIRRHYTQGGWEWGLAIFPRTPHYYQKELTKFFEFMYYRIPILFSGFPVWRDLIGEHGVAIDEWDLDAAARLVIAHRDGFLPYRSLPPGPTQGYTWESQLDRLIKLYESLV